MDEILYSNLSNYFNALEYKGYMPYSQMQKLLVLIFYRDFVYNDYRGLLSKDDYLLIEKALNCLYGSTCLIPYPDYLKMSKLHLGEMGEIASRLKTVEDTKVVKGKNHVTNIPDIDLSSYSQVIDNIND
jgi:hypothetical protein